MLTPSVSGLLSRITPMDEQGAVFGTLTSAQTLARMISYSTANFLLGRVSTAAPYWGSFGVDLVALAVAGYAFDPAPREIDSSGSINQRIHQVSIEIAADRSRVGVAISKQHPLDRLRVCVQDLDRLDQRLGPGVQQLVHVVMPQTAWDWARRSSVASTAGHPCFLRAAAWPRCAARPREGHPGSERDHSNDLVRAPPAVATWSVHRPRDGPATARAACTHSGATPARIALAAPIEQRLQCPRTRNGDRVNHRRHPCPAKLARLAGIPRAHRKHQSRESRGLRILGQ